jgi:hypothetical protein
MIYSVFFTFGRVSVLEEKRAGVGRRNFWMGREWYRDSALNVGEGIAVSRDTY